ncbi:MAG: diacylglycerol kinase family lipid kinase [Odoribacter sp.]|nr:diacylglycerol kinase family lipid kinase [Odoribacter sp.]
MEQGKRILFIVNPHSGWHNGGEFASVLEKIPQYSSVEYDIVMTQYRRHAKELAQSGVESGKYKMIVAVGGDGTVNDVASALVNVPNVAMGVIPMGRGNGFARHLGYSMRLRGSLRQLLSGNEDTVDVMEVNGRYSFNVSGIGFDALVAHVASRTKVRGVFSYVWAAITQFFKYRSHQYKVTVDGKVMQLKAFLFSFANTEQYGSNFVIAPRASVQDGIMELCVIDKVKNVLLIGIDYTRHLFMENNEKTQAFRMFHCKEVKIEGKINIVHIDGEPMFMQSPLNIRVLPRALRVVVPTPEPNPNKI